MKMVLNLWKSLIIEGNVNEEEQRGVTLKEHIFIDLTVGDEEAVEEVKRVATEQKPMRDHWESESESEEPLSSDALSNDELEVANMNDDGMNDVYDLLMNSEGKIVSLRTCCKNASGPSN
jgi:hypothetical protein